ncbi:MAG: GxxExxY protein [Vicinamibacterales bacterium]
MLTNPAGVNDLTEKIIGGAIQVHRDKGPGLLESVYLECMLIELQESGLSVRQSVRVPLTYRGRHLRTVYELDLLVQDRVIVEIKAVSAMAPVHKAQLLTYLKLTGRPVGLLINFNVPVLRAGVSRLVNPALVNRAADADQDRTAIGPEKPCEKIP